MVVAVAIVAALGAGWGIGYFVLRTQYGCPRQETDAVDGGEEVGRPVASAGGYRVVRGYIRTISLATRSIELVATEAEAKGTSEPRFHVLCFFAPDQWQAAMKAVACSREGWRCTVSDMSRIEHEYVIRIGGTLGSRGPNELVMGDCHLQEVLDREPSEASRQRMAAQHQPHAVDAAATPVRDALFAWVTQCERRVLIDPTHAQVTPAGYGYVHVRGKVQNQSLARRVRNVTVTWHRSGSTTRAVPFTLAPREVGSFEATWVFATKADFDQWDASGIPLHPSATGQWEQGVFEPERPVGLPLPMVSRGEQ